MYVCVYIYIYIYIYICINVYAVKQVSRSGVCKLVHILWFGTHELANEQNNMYMHTCTHMCVCILITYTRIHYISNFSLFDYISVRHGVVE